MQCRIPLRKIYDREIETAVGSGVQRGRDPPLIFQLFLDQLVSRRSVGDDIGFVDDACCSHAKRLEDSFLQKVTIELACDFMNENPEREVSEIAVGPLGSGFEG